MKNKKNKKKKVNGMEFYINSRECDRTNSSESDEELLLFREIVHHRLSLIY